TFKYTYEKLGLFSLIRFGKDLSDSTDFNFLFVDEVTDSTAIFAYGTPFVRADSSSGLFGTWKYVKDLKTISITIRANTIDYRETRMDYKTGIINTIEERQGRLEVRKGRFRGQFTIHFSDNTTSTVVPLLYNNIMYLYDISPRKSMFLRAKQTPTYYEYQETIKN
ncbi:hypothetical protein ACFL5B_00375, partial [Candidatus Latescibacterota bacterium]